MSIELPPLPFAMDALEPHMSAETLEYHYGKHHQAYVTNLNKLIEGTEYADKGLENIIKIAEGGIFNNAAQIYNHSFFWQSLSPNGGGKPSGALATAIDENFGSFEKFSEAFASAGATQFGSGWVWLVKDGSHLKIVKTANAETPITEGLIPLLTIDVWEHAYYIDHRNARPAYLKTVIEKLINWDFASANFAG